MAKHGLFSIAAAILMLSAAPAFAGDIYLDDDFEGAAAFADLDWAIKDDTAGAIPTAPQIASTQGINVHAVNGNADQTLPKVTVVNQGALSTAKAYSGTKSVQLNSGQAIRLGNPNYVNRVLNWHMVFQFAFAADDATYALPPGTQVGHYKQDWNTASPVDDIPEVSYQLNFVKNATGGIDVIVAGANIKVATLTQGLGWAIVSMIATKNDVIGWNYWEAYDLINNAYRGPQPAGDPYNGVGDYAQLTRGIRAFVNSNNGELRTSEEIGANWAAANNANNTALVGWEIVAENGATLFVDDMFWAHGLFQDGKMAGSGITKGGAARLIDFVGPGQEPSADARDWQLFE
jgi:hypothetical protein